MAKKKTNKRSSVKKKAEKIHWLELFGILIIAVGLFVFLSLIFSRLTGPAGKFLSNALAGSFGYASYIFPFFIFLLGAGLIFPGIFISFWKFILSLSILFADLVLLFHISGRHGGSLGEISFGFLKPKIGIVGTFILALFTAFVVLLIVFKVSLKYLILRIKKIGIAFGRGTAFIWFVILGALKFMFAKKTAIVFKGASAGGEIEIKDEKVEVSGEVKIEVPVEKEIKVGQRNIEDIKAIEDEKAREETRTEDSAKQKVVKLKYNIPSPSILRGVARSQTAKVTQDYSKLLVDTLESFGVSAKVIHIERGPTVTRYELQPARGVKVSQITNLSNDIALSLAAQSIRIEAPIPGKSAIGIEVPNLRIDPVHVKEILESKSFRKDYILPVAIGKDITGHPIAGDLANMPHLLIAGTTGAGKSVCINAVIASILFRSTPYDVQFLMIDPKRVELTLYEELPHLVETSLAEDHRIVTDPKRATLVLRQMTEEMNSRYKKFQMAKARNISEYNNFCLKNNMERMPYVIVVIDELAELMFISSSAVESSICRLAQLGRASGVHLIIATQRPSVNVITGLIKANMPSRIALAVSSQIDSKIIIDKAGAEKLLGKGDMLYSPIEAMEVIRIQGAYIDNAEIETLADFWKSQPEPTNKIKLTQDVSPDGRTASIEEGDDALFKEALALIQSSGLASTSMLQRKLKIGYARAGRLMDMMEERGIVGPADGSKPRKILMPLDSAELE